jgi:hypothetical protein
MPIGKAAFVQPLPNVTGLSGALSYLSVNQDQARSIMHPSPFIRQLKM